MLAIMGGLSFPSWACEAGQAGAVAVGRHWMPFLGMTVQPWAVPQTSCMTLCLTLLTFRVPVCEKQGDGGNVSFEVLPAFCIDYSFTSKMFDSEN